MSTVLTRRPTKPAKPNEDRFRFGWRYVEHKTPKGRVVVRQVPLTEEDVLHPQEGDFIVNTDLHHRIVQYIKLAAQSRFADQPDVVILGETRIDWGSPYGWAHGPDVVMFTGVQGGWSPDRGTFYLARTKGKVRLVIEATSKATRGNDFGYKLREYFLVGVPTYIIIDVPQDDEIGNIYLYGFEAGAEQYKALPKDAKGRLWLEDLGVWLGVQDRMVYLEDREGNRLPEYHDLVNQHDELMKKVASAEAKVRELAAKLARRSNGKRRNHGTH